MADEKEKIDIEDIKDPEDIDIDEAVEETEPDSAEVVEEEADSKPEVQDEEKVLEGDEKDILEKDAAEATEDAVKKGGKPQKPIKMRSIPSHKKSRLKMVAIVVLACLVTAAAVLGILYYLNQHNKAAETTDTTDNTQIEEEVTIEEEEVVQPKTLYINSEVGLNLRETPNTKAKVLIIIPYGTQITVLAEQAGWVQTTYDGKTGWVSVEFTQSTDPLVYKNETYGFGLTFKPSWAGYKFFEANNSGSTTVKTYYVALPTADKAWDETSSGITKGYASLFVMGIYTKAEWAEMAGGEILPAKLGEGDKYVYTYLPGQAHASDLATQYSEINTIIKTFETLK
jgi:hypothetical protein